MAGSEKGWNKTPLYDTHISAGARIVEFAGFKMPVQYSGIKEEHLAVRRAAGLFDISHMGEIEIAGPEALGFLQYLTPNNASKVAIGAAQYTALLNDRAGIIDDLIFYRLSIARYLLVVNAATTSKDLAWIKKHAPKFNVSVLDRSDKTALLALQGPKSQEILAALSDADLANLRRFHFTEGKVAGARAMISRTGYTGEDGFEIFLDPADAKAAWSRIVEEGTKHGLKPAGLGARDTLRLEMGYHLYGNDADEDHTPFESNLAWICKPTKGEFIGREILLRQKEEGAKEQLIGLVLTSKGVPRHGYDVVEIRSGQKLGGQASLPATLEKVGSVTSGTMSPSLGIGIALARVKSEVAKEGTTGGPPWRALVPVRVGVLIRDKVHEARVTPPPFYKKS